MGKNPTDRGKNGVKRSLVVEGDGGPLGVVIHGKPKPTPRKKQHLCLDKGYDNPTGRAAAACRGYSPHIRRIGEEKLGRRGRKRHPARRWVVERTLGWLSKCRAILIRYDKKASNYLGLIQLACSLLWYRRLSVLR